MNTNSHSQALDLARSERIRHALPLLMLLAVLAACESTPSKSRKLPEPMNAEAGAVAIALDMTESGPVPLPGITLPKPHVRPKTVLFVRMEPGEDVKDVSTKRVVIASTFVQGEYAYLLNALPGRYVAVAALYKEETGPTTAKMGSKESRLEIELSDGKVRHRNYFSRAMVEQSATLVEPGCFAFMGNYAADQSARWGEGDDVQEHFMHVVEGKDVNRSGWLQDLSSEGLSHRLTLRNADRDARTRSEFCEEAKERLKGTQWTSMIDRLMASP